MGQEEILVVCLSTLEFQVKSVEIFCMLEAQEMCGDKTKLVPQSVPHHHQEVY